MGTMRIMSARKGDEHFEWDPDEPASVAAAKQRFDELVAKGHFAYRVERTPHRTGVPVKEFDPQAGELLFGMPIQGG